MTSPAPAPARIAQARRPVVPAILPRLWPRLPRAVWRLLVLSVSLATLGLFCLAIPARIHELSVRCLPGNCAPGQVSASAPASAVSPTYAATLVGGEVLFALLYLLVASIIFWRRPRHRMPLFVAGMLALWGLTFPPTLAALPHADACWFAPVACARFAGAAAITLFFYLFPDGHLRPRGAWALAVLWVGTQIPHYFWPGTRLDFQGWSPAVLALVSAGFLGVMVALQVARYRRSSNALERRQTKWVVLGIVCALLGYAALLGVAALMPDAVAPGRVGFVALSLGEEAAVALIPVCIGVAILRDRLYDIDLLLNRALVYGALSILLTTVYFMVVVALQALARRLARGAQQDDPVVIVLSTLTIAALFQPLRSRLQRAVDRRFFRTRYDSARLLAEVARMIHTEVDLDALTTRLADVVGRAFEPSHVSLWLRPARDSAQRGSAEAGAAERQREIGRGHPDVP